MARHLAAAGHVADAKYPISCLGFVSDGIDAVRDVANRDGDSADAVVIVFQPCFMARAFYWYRDCAGSGSHLGALR
ncbi:MAG: hypothetical protein ACI9G1_002647 [Pirellulaceae bacterium]|jgi:hypothetical protein